MRRGVVMLVVAGAAMVGIAPGARAATSVPVEITLAEPAVNPDCTLADGFCGSGVMKPFGQATETIEFGLGCGGSCDLRTISVSGGSLALYEQFAGSESDFYCPGPPGPCCPSRGHVFKPFRAPLAETVGGGTGVFAGATGTLAGTLWGAGPAGGSESGDLQGGMVRVNLAGTITLVG